MRRSLSLLAPLAVLLALVGLGCRDTRRSTAFDSGVVRLDAGRPVDAGPPRDAGPRPDAGGRPDAGLPPRDAGPGGEGDLRLASGSTSGRLEVFHAGQWGTICDDSFDDNAATVACRQLGFASGVFLGNAEPGLDPILMDDVTCLGSEARLADCSFDGWGVHNCTHSEDVAVECSSSPAP